MDNLKPYLAPLGRLLMSSLFLWSGIHKLRNPGGTAQYFANAHMPAPDVLVWVAIVIEVIGGLAILLGFKTRWAAAVLAIFCLVTAFAVHLPAGDAGNMINFYKNLVMAGGFLYVVAYGAGGMSIDGEKA
ncbi:MAG TPA: DoxX family protein [Xanthobacteraceae bacterium]|jgi:putative oxidoreductase|nr:DoxX family protein [Xanthobacteraceae bacterium]